jgi:indolepyruvate ferredoxin oxidoreductase alpha subunit
MGERKVEHELLMGNEAIARGALEGGVSFCAGYPGNPSTEIIDTLFRYRKNFPMHVEWSTNEMVALEAAAAASFSGLRSLVAMKQNGLSVCLDFLSMVNLTGTHGALVIVVCDDPGPLTSGNEQDSRYIARLTEIPLLEPSTPQEAKDMTCYALALSEKMEFPVMVRSVNRLSHGRAGVIPDRTPKERPTPRFDLRKPFIPIPPFAAPNHQKLHQKAKTVEQEFQDSGFNHYIGPHDADLLVVASGLGWLYAREAISILGLEKEVGLLKVGTMWPIPVGVVIEAFRRSPKILVVEQIEPFLEENLKIIHSEHAHELGPVLIHGKRSGHIQETGELTTDVVLKALREITGLEISEDRDYRATAEEILQSLPPREISYCHGCSHRASFWAIKSALAMDGRQGFVVGDVGCYGMAVGPTGYNQIKVSHCMGSGIGNASGFGVLEGIGFDQPVIAVAGDSTFYHACIPGLINAKANGANVLFVILDNEVTAMTGFQLPPGAASTSVPDGENPIRVEEVCRGLGVETVVLDPIEDISESIEAVFQGLQKNGVHAVVFRRVCATYAKKLSGYGSIKARVIPEKCIGEDCGCNRFCTRVLGCPGNRWDAENKRAYIEPDFCNGCGLCIQLCPGKAITWNERESIS